MTRRVAFAALGLVVLTMASFGAKAVERSVAGTCAIYESQHRTWDEALNKEKKDFLIVETCVVPYVGPRIQVTGAADSVLWSGCYTAFGPCGTSYADADLQVAVHWFYPDRPGEIFVLMKCSASGNSGSKVPKPLTCFGSNTFTFSRTPVLLCVARATAKQAKYLDLSALCSSSGVPPVVGAAVRGAILKAEAILENNAQFLCRRVDGLC